MAAHGKYRESKRRDHPLAKANGNLAEHRRVLYDQLGPDDQPCYWCGWVLPWKHENGLKWCINVDHLNEDRSDNRLTNLVPSCWWCNANRSWSHVAPTVWNLLRRQRQIWDVHPAERQSATLILARRLEQYERSLMASQQPHHAAKVVPNDGGTTHPESGPDEQ